MQDSTSPHHLTPVDPRIAALEDHLARETRSSQALAARVAELEALCAVLGVVPELPADGEPRFLPLADIKDTGRTSLRYLPLSEMKVEGVGGFTDPASGQWVPCITSHKPGTPRGTVIDDFGTKFGALCDAEQARDARKEAQ